MHVCKNKHHRTEFSQRLLSQRRYSIIYITRNFLLTRKQMFQPFWKYFKQMDNPKYTQRNLFAVETLREDSYLHVHRYFIADLLSRSALTELLCSTIHALESCQIFAGTSVDTYNVLDWWICPKVGENSKQNKELWWILDHGLMHWWIIPSLIKKGNSLLYNLPPKSDPLVSAFTYTLMGI